ncbi:MAG: aspartate-semialdehyde dehydrogenase [Clostridiales Family XIII bacterium]|jgi:aspartate-semialdehyde dehydrogenase|nr:aspartate-semialdehyde dehydrogenase [Clostridiales Family XIII bacterium]
MNRKPNLAIVGATGMVGTTFLKVLEERNFPYEKVYLLAAPDEDGAILTFDGRDYRVEGISDQSFDGKDIDIALFSAGGGPSAHFAPIAAARGILVVDNSSQWRMDPDVPLVVPEVNPQAAFTAFGKKMIIANPNCSTIQAMVALKPLQDTYGLKRIVYSTYQAVSGSGVRGTHELSEGLKGNDLCVAYPHPIANNCLPHIDVFEENGYTKEEMKMINETHKILDDDSIAVTATTVRLPVFYSHSESINVEMKTPFDVEDVRRLFADAPGIILKDDPASDVYPLARDAAGTDEVYVGRIRRDFSVENGLNIWCVADNIRKGAATNTVQIAQLVLDRVTA